MLCLDIGNSRIKGAAWRNERFVARFEDDTGLIGDPSAFGDRIRQAFAAQGLAVAEVDRVSACHVLTETPAALASCCLDLFGCRPFILNAETQTSLRLHYRVPGELGPDRIAAAIGAADRWPDENLIVIDCGTATTFCCIDGERNHRGGVIAAGPAMMAEALHARTARLPDTKIREAPPVLGRSTRGGIESGVFYGALGMLREITRRLRDDCFPAQPVRVVGGGGFAPLFRGQGVFDDLDPDLVLRGLRVAHARSHPDPNQHQDPQP